MDVRGGVGSSRLRSAGTLALAVPARSTCSAVRRMDAHGGVGIADVLPSSTVCAASPPSSKSTALTGRSAAGALAAVAAECRCRRGALLSQSLAARAGAAPSRGCELDGWTDGGVTPSTACGVEGRGRRRRRRRACRRRRARGHASVAQDNSSSGGRGDDGSATVSGAARAARGGASDGGTVGVRRAPGVAAARAAGRACAGAPPRRVDVLGDSATSRSRRSAPRRRWASMPAASKHAPYATTREIALAAPSGALGWSPQRSTKGARGATATRACAGGAQPCSRRAASRPCAATRRPREHMRSSASARQRLKRVPRFADARAASPRRTRARAQLALPRQLARRSRGFGSASPTGKRRAGKASPCVQPGSPACAPQASRPGSARGRRRRASASTAGR